MRLARSATSNEVNYYRKCRDIDKCCLPDCPNEHTKAACDYHMAEFMAQRQTGIHDFRLWALAKMDRFDVNRDPTVARWPVQISTSPCQHKQQATLKAPNAVSLARMWQEVYDRSGLPEEDIYEKFCACCESEEFSQSADYICLWCRWAEL
jgi:hypothetical protein